MTWVRSRAATAGVAGGLALVVLGALLGRPDVAVLVAAPLVAGMRDWRRRPSVAPTVRLEASDAPPTAGALPAEVVVASPSGVLLGARRGSRVLFDAWVLVDGTRRLPMVVRTVRTGPQELALVDVQGVGPGAASVSEPSPSASRSALVLPAPRPLGDLPLPPRSELGTRVPEPTDPGDQHVKTAITRAHHPADQPLRHTATVMHPLDTHRHFRAVRQRNRLRVDFSEA